MKKNTLILIIALLGLSIIFYVPVTNKKTPPLVTMGVSASLRELTIDEKIKEADLIIIGEAKSVLPVKWNSQNGKKLSDATPEEVFQAGGLFTDTLISVEQILKGDDKGSVVRVRSFAGKTDQIHWVNSSEPNYKKGTNYLLFLEKDYGSTQMIDPEHYISVNSNTAIYEIVNSKAVSVDDEWMLGNLINYIQISLFAAPSNLLDAPEAKSIIQTIENAYDIESEASYTFDLSKFPSVFVNDPRYELNLDALEIINASVDNSSLEVSGYLDYKVDYYNWWKEGWSQFDNLRKKVIAENRNMTDEELNAFLASKWGNIPGRVKDTGRHFKIKFVSVNVDNDIATVIFDVGPKTNELYLVLINGQWYIAGNKENSIPINPAAIEIPIPTGMPTQTPLPEITPTP